MLWRAQIFFLVCIAFFAIYLGIIQSFFTTIWWWDIPAHFFAGAWAGMFGAWFFAHWGRRLSIIECAAFALGVGISWEVFEVATGTGGSIFMSYWADTIKDLCMDVFGGVLAGIITRRAKI